MDVYKGIPLPRGFEAVGSGDEVADVTAVVGPFTWHVKVIDALVPLAIIHFMSMRDMQQKVDDDVSVSNEKRRR